MKEETATTGQVLSVWQKELFYSAALFADPAGVGEVRFEDSCFSVLISGLRNSIIPY